MQRERWPWQGKAASKIAELSKPGGEGRSELFSRSVLGVKQRGKITMPDEMAAH